jgi:tetratricopeptide (TPR) repeat protein
LNRTKILSTAVILLSSTLALALPQSTPPAAGTPAPQAAPAPAQNAATPAASKSPQPKTQAEYDAFKAAASQNDPVKLQAAATDFAQKFPDSELRPFLFQQAMGEYQAANNSEKALEMARTVLKFDPNNAVALLTAAQILAERTHDTDLDRDDRLAEAESDARSALHHAGDIPQPPNLTPEQYAGAMAQLRGTAHEVIATVAFKKLDYFTAIKEYNAAASEEKEHTDAVVWLRLAVANDKSGDFSAATEAVNKAIAASEPGSQIRQLAEQESSRLSKLSVTTPTKK